MTWRLPRLLHRTMTVSPARIGVERLGDINLVEGAVWTHHT